MQASHSQIKTGITAAMLSDFSQLSQHLLHEFKHRYGFESAFLFMKHPVHERLDLVNASHNVSVELKDNQDLLVQAFELREILISNAPQRILNNFLQSSASPSSYILLPIDVSNKGVGIFLLSTEQTEFNDHEKTFLKNHASQFALPLLTSWELSHNQEIVSQLKEVNQDYRGLIEVKQAFLEQVQELLGQSLDDETISEEQRTELICALAYLQSVLLLSKRTLK